MFGRTARLSHPSARRLLQPGALRQQTRSFAARAYTVRKITASGVAERFSATPRSLVDHFELLPRDGRLLATSNAHIAVRENYFLFRFPPFTGAVRHDAALVIAADDDSAAAEHLQQRLIRANNASTAGSSDWHWRADDNVTDIYTKEELPFEHRVLEAVLHEDTLHKLDRYTRLATLIEDATAPATTSDDGKLTSMTGYYVAREQSLYRLMTLSRWLGALALDVKRSSAALASLLASDEDMAGTYLTSKYQRGAAREIDQHVELELMLESFATEHEDLSDKIEELQETVETHRLIEQIRLSNERNRIMRIELLLSFSTCSLAVCACVGGFFGMNLHSGMDELPYMLWYVSGGTSLAAGSLFAAFVLSVRRFHALQQAHVESTDRLDRAIDTLDTAYFALRQAQQPLEDGNGASDTALQPLTNADSVRPTLRPITRETLQAALQKTATLSGGQPLPPNAVDDLWSLLDANGDGVLTEDEQRPEKRQQERTEMERALRGGL
jgi:Mg2+ and Co2+ transporter CorA